MVENQNQKFAERFEHAAADFIIMEKAIQQNGVTKENLQQTFRGNLQSLGQNQNVDQCLQHLTQSSHLRQEGNKYVATDDGRQDTQRLQGIVLELANVVNQGGSKPGMTSSTGAAGTGTSTGMGSGTGRSSQR